MAKTAVKTAKPKETKEVEVLDMNVSKIKEQKLTTIEQVIKNQFINK